MSGGQWDYKDQYEMQEVLAAIALDLREEYPKLSLIFSVLTSELPKLTHELDYDFSSDSLIEDKSKFDNEQSKKLLQQLGAITKLGELQVELDKLKKKILSTHQKKS